MNITKNYAIETFLGALILKLKGIIQITIKFLMMKVNPKRL